MGPTLTNIYDLVALSLYVPYTARGGQYYLVIYYIGVKPIPRQCILYCSIYNARQFCCTTYSIGLAKGTKYCTLDKELFQYFSKFKNKLCFTFNIITYCR